MKNLPAYKYQFMGYNNAYLYKPSNEEVLIVKYSREIK